jgi:hypothetical protein
MYFRHDVVKEATAKRKEQKNMNVVPTRLAEQANRVDRNRSLAIGISSGVLALWSVYRVLWTIYLAATFSSVGWSPVSLVFPIVLWGVIGVAAGISAVAFLSRYQRHP